MTIDDATGITCARCNRDAPVDLDELRGDGGGDPSLLPVIIPPYGWIGDPDGDGVVCAECASPDEITAGMDETIQALRLMRHLTDQ